MIVDDRTAATSGADANTKDVVPEGEGRADGQPDQVADVRLVGDGLAGQSQRRQSRSVLVSRGILTGSLLLPAQGAGGGAGSSGGGLGGQPAAEDDEGQGRPEGGILAEGRRRIWMRSPRLLVSVGDDDGSRRRSG